MRKMAFKIKDMPPEVFNILCIRLLYTRFKGGASQEIKNEWQKVIDKYPEWFPENPSEEIPLSKERLQQIQANKKPAR